MAQSARNPAAPIARYNRSSMGFLHVFRCVDGYHEMPGGFEHPAPLLRPPRPPTVPARDHDQGVAIERERNRLLLVPAHVHPDAYVGALRSKARDERVGFDR